MHKINNRILRQFGSHFDFQLFKKMLRDAQEANYCNMHFAPWASHNSYWNNIIQNGRRVVEVIYCAGIREVTRKKKHLVSQSH